MLSFGALRYPNFRYLWFGTILSSAGQWVQQVTLGWLVYSMTGSSVMLGMVNGMRAFPFLIAGPFAGVVADRVDRRNLMLATQLFLVVVTVAMGIVIAMGALEVWHLFAFTLCTGIAWSFNQPVRQAVVANVVPREALTNAIGLNSAGFNLTRVIGPTVAGILIVWFGAAGNFFIQGLAYLGVCGMILATRLPASPVAARKSSMAANMMEGGRWVWRQRQVRTLMVLGLVPVLFALPYTSLMPVFAEDVLHVGPAGLGLLLSASGIGALAGALGVAMRRPGKRGRFQLATLAGLGVGLVLFSQTRSMLLAVICLALTGACQQSYMATNQTLLQVLIPDELRGRVMSIWMLNQGLLPLGSLFAGIFAHAVGAPITVAVMGGLCLMLAVVGAIGFPESYDF